MIFTPGEMAEVTVRKELLDNLSDAGIIVRIEGEKQNG